MTWVSHIDPNPYPNCSGHTDYINNDSPLSPWRIIDGWHLGTCFHDPMHVLYLGTCRDLYASALGFWVRNGHYGEGSLTNKLRSFSSELKSKSRQQKNLPMAFGCSLCFFLHIWNPKKLEKVRVNWWILCFVIFLGFSHYGMWKE